MAEATPIIASLALALTSVLVYLAAQAKADAKVALALVKVHDDAIKKVEALHDDCKRALKALGKTRARK